jgi:hypothetical protein
MKIIKCDKNLFVLVLSFFFCMQCVSAQPTEKLFEHNKTATYNQVIDFYSSLDKNYRTAKLFQAGLTDVGLPLHVFVISADAVFDADVLHKKNKTIVLINNGIHAGEPCGIDACMTFAKDLLKTELKKTIPNTIICIIPVYNIDGSLQRSCCSRANQNGPDEYGFRANYQNLDLNRDFIKADSENAKSFIQIFQQWKPHVFVDTHISDGADYTYNMTLIATQKDKLHPLLSKFMQSTWLPQWYKAMQIAGEPMCPYVDTKTETPDSGLVGFFEPPRFASGYAALFNTWAFVSESHMLKPYHKQVLATITLLNTMVPLVELHGKQMRSIKQQADSLTKLQDSFALQYRLQSKSTDSIWFEGYTTVRKISTVSNLPYITYNKNEPYKKYIPFYNDYNATLVVKKPKYYLLPQCFKKVIQLLQLNQISMVPLHADTTIAVTAYYIDDYKTVDKPYEGHYLHSKVKLHTTTQHLKFLKGDMLIPVNQANNYLVQVLEPQATDAFFAWNFFDACLQQKEGFSDYVFEQTAAQMLENNTALTNKLKQAVAENNWQNNHYQQLNYLYKESPMFEKTFMRYPVFRIE